MITEKLEKKILHLSFGAGLAFAITEFIMAIYSHSQSVLMDAAYDATELVIIGLVLFLTPLFHKPISEKRPFGYAQVESIFVIVKGFMMLSVTLGLSATSIETALHGGNRVNGGQISLFQLVLGLVSFGVYLLMRYWNRPISSPTIKAELFDWKLDVAYSLGMSVAFFVSTFLDNTPLAFLSPYFDQVVAIAIVVSMLPENMKMLWRAIEDVFLFSPEADTVAEIKLVCDEILVGYSFESVFYDITRTGRRLWVAVYFKTQDDLLSIAKLQQVSDQVNDSLGAHFENCICELVPAMEHSIQVSDAPQPPES